MPRDNAGVYTPPRNWTQDATNKVPFDPTKWDQQDTDFAAALNDLPLKTVVPTWVVAGTDPATVNPGSLMRDAGIIYIRPDEPVWLDISSPSTDPDADWAAAIAQKAPLISPALTGTPTVPTAAPGTNTTQAASTAFVKTADDSVLAQARADMLNSGYMFGCEGLRMANTHIALRGAASKMRGTITTARTLRLFNYGDSVAGTTCGPWSANIQRKMGGPIIGAVRTQASEEQAILGGKIAPLLVSVGTAPQVSSAYQYGATGQYYNLSSNADLTWGISGNAVTWTKAKIFYVKESGAGSMEWFINGVSQGVVSAANATVELGVLNLTNATVTANTPLRSLITVAGVKILYVLYHNDTENGVWRFDMTLGGLSLHDSMGNAQGKALTAAMLAEFGPDVAWIAQKENITEGASQFVDRLNDLAGIIDANTSPATDVIIEISNAYVPRANYDSGQQAAAVSTRDTIIALCKARTNYLCFDGYLAMGQQGSLDRVISGFFEPIRIKHRGAWDVATVYSLNDTSYPAAGGTTYRYVNSTPTSGNALTNTTYWRPQFAAYAGGTTYSKHDVVSSGGWYWAYINATPGAGNAPPTYPTLSNAYWQFAEMLSADGTHPETSASQYLVGLFNSLTGLESSPFSMSARPVNDTGMPSLLASGTKFSAGKQALGYSLEFSALSPTVSVDWVGKVAQSFGLVDTVNGNTIFEVWRYGYPTVGLLQYATWCNGPIVLDARQGNMIIRSATIGGQLGLQAWHRTNNARTTIDGLAYYVNGTKVLGARDTGWAAMTGTASKVARDTATVTLQQLAERVKAHDDAMIAHGLIGA